MSNSVSKVDVEHFAPKFFILYIVLGIVYV